MTLIKFYSVVAPSSSMAVTISSFSRMFVQLNVETRDDRPLAEA